MSIRSVFRSTCATMGLAAMCSGCTNDPCVHVPIRIVSNEIVEVPRAVAHIDGQGLRIDGDVRRRDGYANPVAGHLVVTAFKKDGSIAAMTDAMWGQFANRRFRLAYFRARLPIRQPEEIGLLSIDAVADPHR